MNKIKKGDSVIVISGKYKGLKTTVIEVLTEKKRVRIENAHNIRHFKPNARKNTPGGRNEIAASVHLSNVMLYSETAGRGVRPKFKAADTGKKIRVCPKTGNTLEK